MAGSTRLFIPMRTTGGPSRTLRIGRLPDGTRTGIAFTSASALVAVMGPGCEVMRLGESSYRAMLVDIGVLHLRTDPMLVAPPLNDTLHDDPVKIASAGVRNPSRSGGRGVAVP